MKKKKRGKKKKQDGWCEKLRFYLVTIAWTFPCAFVFYHICKLAECTLAPFYPEVWWGIIIASVLVVLISAWWTSDLSGDFRELIGGLLALAGMGFIAGLIINILWQGVFLGLNYYFPRSAPYQKTAVVYNKRIHHYQRSSSLYGIGLRCDDGSSFYWNSGYSDYENFRRGDTCSVTMYEGLFGFEVIQDVKVIKKAKILPPDDLPDWMKNMLHIKTVNGASE